MAKLTPAVHAHPEKSDKNVAAFCPENETHLKIIIVENLKGSETRYIDLI